MSISYIILAIVLCTSADIFAMEQQAKQKEASVAQDFRCWMCEKNITEGQSAKLCTMRTVPVQGDSVLSLGGLRGKQSSSFLHAICCDPVLNCIKQHPLQGELISGVHQKDVWHEGCEELLYAVYVLARAQQKTVQKFILDNKNDVPNAVFAILGGGTFMITDPQTCSCNTKN